MWSISWVSPQCLTHTWLCSHFHSCMKLPCVHLCLDICHRQTVVTVGRVDGQKLLLCLLSVFFAGCVSVHGCVSVYISLCAHTSQRRMLGVFLYSSLSYSLGRVFQWPRACHFNEASWPLTSSYIPWSMGTHSHAWLFTWILRVQTQVLMCAQLTNKLSLPLAHLLLFLQGRSL